MIHEGYVTWLNSTLPGPTSCNKIERACLVLGYVESVTPFSSPNTSHAGSGNMVSERNDGLIGCVNVELQSEAETLAR